MKNETSRFEKRTELEMPTTQSIPPSARIPGRTSRSVVLSLVLSILSVAVLASGFYNQTDNWWTPERILMQEIIPAVEP